jgi:hypothetical protein
LIFVTSVSGFIERAPQKKQAATLNFVNLISFVFIFSPAKCNECGHRKMGALTPRDLKPCKFDCRSARSTKMRLSKVHVATALLRVRV